MDKTQLKSYRSGQRYAGSLPAGADLAETIENICRTYSITTGVFSIIGMTDSATIGVYDHQQQVYVTHVEKEATEVLSCWGIVSLKDNAPCVTAKIILADQQGNLTGGHLFSKTIIRHAEIVLQELIGDPLKRVYNPENGLSRLQKH